MKKKKTNSEERRLIIELKKSKRQKMPTTEKIKQLSFYRQNLRFLKKLKDVGLRSQHTFGIVTSFVNTLYMY